MVVLIVLLKSSDDTVRRAVIVMPTESDPALNNSEPMCWATICCEDCRLLDGSASTTLRRSVPF
jgi:hypothetical protein